MSGNIDRITGRIKQAAGDLVDDPDLRESGVRDEQKATAKEELHRAQAEADAKAQEVADLERGGEERGSQTTQQLKDAAHPDRSAQAKPGEAPRTG